MKLSFSQEHNSVKAFEPITLPDFTVLTGRNGSGKSHIMEAITLGKIHVEGIDTNRIQKFDYRDFDYNYQRRTDRGFKQNAWNAIQPETNTVSMRLVALDEIVQSREIVEKKAKELDKPFVNLKIEDFIGEGLSEEQAQGIATSIEQYKHRVEDFLYEDPNSSDEVAQSIYDSLIRNGRRLVSSYTESQFTSSFKKSALSGRRLLSDISDTFYEYHQEKTRNDLNRDRPGHLTGDEFIAKFGEAPWDTVQEIFDGMKINFSVSNPEEEKTDAFSGTFQIKFRNNDRGGQEINFDALSSGEKILLTLVNSVFTAKKKNLMPKLILLDEIDGPLNPSVLSGFVEYIQSYFLENGAKVIIATHSPSTVAFSPAESVFLVNTSTNPLIVSIDKKTGISNLSEGYITIQDLLEFSNTPTSKLIISEGKNYRLLETAKTLFSTDEDLSILHIRELGSGQLRVLYDFLRKFNLTKNFIFVWDNDYRFKDDGSLRNLDDLKNLANQSAKVFIFNDNPVGVVTRGIENLFDSTDVAEYEGTYKPDNSGVNNKARFEKFLTRINSRDVFKNFEQLFEFISNTTGTSNL